MKFRIRYTSLVVLIIVLITACGNSLLVEPDRGSPANQQKTPLPNLTFTPTITKVVAISLYTPQPPDPNAPPLTPEVKRTKERLPNPTATPTITPVVAIEISPTPTTSMTSPVNTWELYIDEQANYSFRYKSDEAYLNVSKNINQDYNTVDIGFKMPDIHEYQGMTISVLPNPENLSVQEFLKQYYEVETHKQPPKKLTSFNETILVAGQSAIKTTLLSSEEYSTYAFHILIPNQNMIYLIGPMYGGLTGTQVYSQTTDHFFQILETFTIQN